MKELNNAIGAMFLVNAKMTVQVETSIEMQQQMSHLPEGYMEERLHRDMIERLSRELYQKFEKEIKIEPSHFGGERHSLGLYVFTEPMFKRMVEYIISQIPEEKLQEIRSNLD
jgi:hypothetical protein